MLRVVKVNISSIDWEEGVGQCSTQTIEIVSVPVFSVLEPDVNMDLTAGPLLKGEVGHPRPDLPGFSDLGVDILLGHLGQPGILGDLVSDVGHSPPGPSTQSMTTSANLISIFPYPEVRIAFS